MKINRLNFSVRFLICFVVAFGASWCQAQDKFAKQADSGELNAPVKLVADGKPIDIGKLSKIAHAGPCIGDIDCDGDQDLLVGDFPGHFWFFENTGTDEKPVYASKGKLQAGGVDAKTPVY